MAAPSKKRATDEEMQLLEEKENDDNFDEEDGMDEDSDDSDMVQEEVQVDFEARAPEDCDFQGIRKLLGQNFLKANVNISELADTIISQNYIGSVVKQGEIPMEDDDSEEDDDGEVFGVLSVLNITERKELDCLTGIKALILDRCKECAEKQTANWKQLLYGDEDIGFIVSERFINIPPQIALPSYESLQKEIAKAVKKKMKYSFDYYLLMAKTYKFPQSAAKSGLNTDQLAFANAEEEYFYSEADLKFDFSVASQRDTVVGGMWDDDDGEMLPYRTVMLVPASKMEAIMIRMRETLSLQT